MRWENIKAEGENSRKKLCIGKKLLTGKKLNTQVKNPPNHGKNPKNSKKILNQEPKIGALNPNSVLCTDQAASPAFSALNPGSTLNPRTLNPGTTVLFPGFFVRRFFANFVK